MQVRLIRHGMTQGNALHQYIGVTDQPLSPEGVGKLADIAYANCGTVFVSPLLRTRQTAELLFPGAAQVVVDDLREMDFGAFEGRSAADMEQDADYRAWVDGMCQGPCPGGETMAEFGARVCRAFEAVLRAQLAAGAEETTFVIHGGSIMAILARFVGEKRGEFYSYYLDNGQGYACQAALQGDALVLTMPEKLH